MSRESDALETIIRDTTWGLDYSSVQAIAKAVLAAGWHPDKPPTLTTTEQLEALPLRAVVRCPSSGEVYLKVTRSFFGWRHTHQAGRASAEHILEQTPGVELIYVPEAKEPS